MGKGGRITMDGKTLEEKLQFIEDYKKASNAATGSKFDSNANVTSKNLATLTCELGKKDLIDLRRALTRKYLAQNYGDKYVESYMSDLKNHIIYAHDETSILSYCAAVSLYPFLLNGLKDLGGNSLPPKHANSFIGGIINLIFLLAGQFAGAIAVPELLTYFDHFLRIDFGDDYIDHLDEEFGYHMTLRHMIEDWFQQLIYTLNEPASARNYQSTFTNIAYFDKYYFASIFQDFVFPDGDEPKWETTKELQKMFMKWFNKERTKAVLTFPVESMNMLVEGGEYKDTEMADFAAEMWSEGHSFFMYQDDSVASLSSCCRLRNSIDENVFSYTLGAGGVETGSKCVITLNLNRIVQDWYRSGMTETLAECIKRHAHNVHIYLQAWNDKLHDDFDAGLLTVYSAGFIELDKQFLTVGVNGFVEAAEFLRDHANSVYNGIDIDPDNDQYRQLAQDILGTIEAENRKDRTERCKFNLEFVPAENAAKKLYDWDKEDSYYVPSGRNLYNSYFYVVEDPNIDPVKKFYYQGRGFADVCSGGVALHNNLSEHLTKKQYRMLMDTAVKAGCNYFTYNIPNTICNDCGHIDKRMLHECPVCGSKNIDYATRIIGYLKRVSNFSEARQIEASRRYYGDLK